MLPPVALQSGAGGPLVVLLAALVLVGLGWYALREPTTHRPQHGRPEDRVVCPRCRHTTDPGSDYCPECGLDLD